MSATMGLGIEGSSSIAKVAYATCLQIPYTFNLAALLPDIILLQGLLSKASSTFWVEILRLQSDLLWSPETVWATLSKAPQVSAVVLWYL